MDEKTNLVEVKLRLTLYCISTVSYTHLDVYKRQTKQISTPGTFCHGSNCSTIKRAAVFTTATLNLRS